MLLECAVLQEYHDGYYTADSLNTLFEPIPETCIVMVGEIRCGVTGFATIYATGSHRLLVQVHAKILPHKNNYSNLANETDRIY